MEATTVIQDMRKPTEQVENRWKELIIFRSYLIFTVLSFIDKLYDFMLLHKYYKTESIATLPTFGPQEGQKWFFQISRSLRKTGLHESLSAKSSFYLPAFEISRSCRTASSPPTPQPQHSASDQVQNLQNCYTTPNKNDQ